MAGEPKVLVLYHGMYGHIETMAEISGGSPYGAPTIAGACFRGRPVTEIARRLAG